MDVTSWMDLDHDTIVWEDSKAFEKQISGNAGTELIEGGKYFVLYNEAMGITGTLNRCTFQTQLLLDGSVVGGSAGHGFIRGSQGCDECFPFNGCIIDAVAGDILKVQTQQQAAGTPSPTRTGGYSGFQLLKLDDDWDYCRLKAYRPGVIQDPGDTIQWNSTIEIDAGSFELDAATKRKIKLKTAGWYLCCYSLGWTNNSSPPVRSICVAYVKNNGIPAWEVEQSYSSSYVRVTSGNDGATNAVFFIHTTIANEEITLETWTDLAGGGGTFGSGSNCYISLVKLPSTTLGLDVYDGTGGESFDVSETPFPWPDQTDVDSPFDHSVVSNTDDIIIKKPGPFLFTGNFHGYRSTGSDRFNTLARFRDGGTALSYGCFGDYHRQSTGVPYHGGSNGVIFPWLSVDDVIDMSREDTSTSSGGGGSPADYPETEPDKMGVQAIYLPSVFPKYWQNGGFFLQQAMS